MTTGVCKLIQYSSNYLQFEDSPPISHGKLVPKDGKNYRVLILNDNPDINSIALEKKLVSQALREYEERLTYGIEVYDIAEYNKKYGITFFDPKLYDEKYLTRIRKIFDKIDVFIQYRNPEQDDFFKENTNAYGGYPNGSYKGIIRMNNKRLWLDGYDIDCDKAKKLGLIINCTSGGKLGTNSTRRTVKHEFGHVLGEEHNEGVMSRFYDFTQNMLGKVTLHSLDNNYGLRSVGSRWMKFIKRVMTRPISRRYI